MAAITTELNITPDIYTVTRLNQETQLLLESHFRVIWVQGEISNLTKASSGHFYFSLKDAEAQVRCAYFRNRHTALTLEPVNGLQVLACAKVSLYTPRGDYQLIIEHLQEQGAGLLQLEFEKLKQKLAQQGLFDEKYKQQIPTLPRCIGVITSPQGAAIRDILTTLNKRFPAIPVIIYPTEVQGKTAAPKIAAALNIANLREECDVLLLARGGGSMEDLWPFNEEIVAQAVFNSKIPIITGIGHQIDYTIADFVADLRTATPTAAAAAACPNQADWLRQTQHLCARAQHAVAKHIHFNLIKLTKLHHKLRDPHALITRQWQTLDRLTQRLKQALQRYLMQQRVKLMGLTKELTKTNPTLQLQATRQQLALLGQRKDNAIQQTLTQKRHALGKLIATLNAMSPLATLERGYAIAMTMERHIIRCSDDVNAGDEIVVKLAQGELLCKINSV